MLSKYKLNVFFSTLNFILCFVGFQVVTSLLLPGNSDIEGITQSITIPYRAFALFISLFVIFINFKKKINPYPLALQVFIFFWILLIIRIFYDDFIRKDIKLGNISQIWIYIIGICIPSFVSIIKSYNYIDLEKSFRYVLILTGLSLLFTLFSNQAFLISVDEVDGRQAGNAAISTIAFGHFGTTAIILGLYTFLLKKVNWLYKICLIILILLGFYSMLRAGSRGPILALIIVLLFWLFSFMKKPLYSIFSLIFVSILMLIFIDYILELTGQVSPIIESRLRGSIYGGDTSNRDLIYSRALEGFYESPIFGKQFILINSDGSLEYSHNIILDAFLGLGIVGGWAVIYFLIQAFKKSYYLINTKNPNYWICLLLIQQIISNMISSAIYYNQLLSVLLVFVFVNYRKKYVR